MIQTNVITLRVVHISKRYPKGAYVAGYYDGGAYKSKQCALHVNEPDIAYQTVDLWAEFTAKETGLKYIKSSRKELQDMIDTGKRRAYNSGNGTEKKPSDGISTGNTRSILSNQKYFKNEINRVFETLGYKRLSEMLKVGTDHLNELNDECNSRVENLCKAKEAMAQTMYQSYLDTSIDMSEFCSDTEIVNRFKALKENTGQLI